MYLKDLTLRGFKSFASATKFRFEPGITCIVGPNGSGKSNVVDALSWVMGEQGAKSLRGGNMSDVIFAGSTGRPALGRAQVELTIDNADGRLPISYSEVTISRTMFRSGGSEYAINGQTVRLLDVQELLSDTGMGRQMHAIVGQGQLDRVLTATPLDRRAFIDEAAGVAKHRRRKERALRKLEAMEANLVRVLDLTEEIKKQLRPLARQAKAAREAAGVREKLDYARARLLAADTLDAHEKMVSEHRALEELRKFTGSAEAQIDQIREQLACLQAKDDAVSAELDRMQERYRDFREVEQRLRSVVDLAQERAAGAERIPVAISDESVDLARKRASEAAEESDLLAQASTSAREAAGAAERLRLDQQAAVDGARTVLGEKQREHEVASRRYLEYERALERARSVLTGANQQVARSQTLLQEARARLGSLPPLESATNLRGTSERAANLEEGVSAAHSDYERAVQAENEARDRLAVAEREERQAAEEYSRQSARRDTLRRSLGVTESEDKKEASSEKPRMPRELLASFLKVETGWEEAIGALLGSMVNASVLDPGVSLVDAQLLLAEASAETPGVVLQAEHGRSGDPVDSSGDRWSPAVAVIGERTEVAAPVAELLRGCWVADDSRAAADFLSRADNGAVKVATRDGKVFTRHTVQVADAEGPTTLKLAADLKEAEKQAAKARAQLEDVTRAAHGVRDALARAAEIREEALETLRKDDAQRAAAAQERARVEALHHAARQEVDRAQEQLLSAEKAAEEADRALDELRQGDVPPKPAAIEEFLMPYQSALDKAENELSEARDAAASARLESHVAEERARAGERQARAYRAQVEQLHGDRERQLQRQSRAQRVVGEAKSVVDRAREGMRSAETKARKALEGRESLAAQKQTLTSEKSQARDQLDELERTRTGAREQLLQAEVAFAQFQGKYNHFLEEVQRLRVDYAPQEPQGPSDFETSAEQSAEQAFTDAETTELPPDVADFIQEFGPYSPFRVNEDEEVPFSREVAVDALKKAERELARLGVVNPLAVEEHAALKARYDFLLEQVDDLNRSNADLLALIKEVDAQVKEAFVSAFEDTANQFSVVFERLFPGGTGRLELTEPDDPLSTGVEIYARPSGKKVTRLSLLSGGERSMAALAYLIAIFLARPSPFYVMDEVEAALDDTNLGRVLGLFEDLRSESQLLVITHQKRTMEVADALYGVSMRDGVTAVMSHRMH